MDIALYPNDFLTRLHYFGLGYLIRLDGNFVAVHMIA